MKDPKWIELQRLLYCMEKHPEPVEGQSWQSLLLRAQLAQDLWHQAVAPNCNLSQEEYNSLAFRVDQACRRAQELANVHQQKQQEEEATELFGSEEDGHKHCKTNAMIDDVIENLFFAQEASKQAQDENESLQETLESYYDEYEDDDDNNDDAEHTEADQSPNQYHQQSHHHQSSSSPSLEDLQQAQREQMEQAISLMAKQMKEATQGIHATLQQQTKSTLNELETVAEQNVQDVTQVSQNIQQHNSNRLRSNFGTWTLLLTVICVFVFVLVTIFTIPKSPNACFGPCNKIAMMKRGLTMTMSTAKRGYKESRKLYTRVMNPDDIWYDDDDDYPDDSDASTSNNEADSASESYQKWKSLYDENELERKQKEELDKLLQDMKEGHQQKKAANKKKRQEVPDWREALEPDEMLDDDNDDNEQDNPWGQKPVDMKLGTNNSKDDEEDDDNPWRMKPVRIEGEGKKKAKKAKKQKAALPEPDEADDDNPWGQKPVQVKKQAKIDDEEEDNPWGMKPVKMAEQRGGVENQIKDNTDDVVAEPNGDQELEKDEDNPWGVKPVDMEESGVKNGLEDANVVAEETVDQDREPDTPPEPVDVEEPVVENGLEDANVTPDEQNGDQDSAQDMPPEPMDAEEPVANAAPDEHNGDHDRAQDMPPEPVNVDEPVAENELEDANDMAAPNSDQGQEEDVPPEPVDREETVVNAQVDDADIVVEPESGNESEEDNPVGTEPVQTEEPGDSQRLDDTDDPVEPNAMVTQQEQVESSENEDSNQAKDPNEVDMADLMASLQHHARQKDSILAAQEKEHAKQAEMEYFGTGSDNTAEPSASSSGFADDNAPSGERVPDAFERAGEAKKRVSPRDLRLAAANGQVDNVKEFLGLYPDYVNRQDKNGWSPLHMAARKGLSEVLLTLLEFGADKDLITKTGERAYQIAAQHLGREHEAVELLRPLGVFDAGDLHFAAFKGNDDSVRQLLEQHAEFVNVPDHNGWTALHEAARNGDMATLQVLLQFGADKNILTKNGESAFQLADVAKGRNHEAVELVRPQGFVDEIDVRLAAGAGNVDKLTEFLSLRPEFANRQDGNGWTVLHEAARSGEVSVLKTLLEFGGDPGLQTTDGESVHQIALIQHGQGHEATILLRPKHITDEDEHLIQEERRKKEEERRNRGIQARREERKRRREAAQRQQAQVRAEAERLELMTEEGRLAAEERDRKRAAKAKRDDEARARRAARDKKRQEDQAAAAAAQAKVDDERREVARGRGRDEEGDLFRNRVNRRLVDGNAKNDANHRDEL